jgi:outer membrane protein assembly factor BamE (lipoprotein component of BamABCDE complex)
MRFRAIFSMRILPFLFLLFCTACISSTTKTGVVNVWRDASLPAFERGKTTQAEVAKALGPPSQLVNLEEQVVFYYLNESAKTRGFILIVYNQTRERVVYDRAIFFFDKRGILQDFALSIEESPYEPPGKDG